MTTYRKIHGRSIQAVTTDPTESVAEGQVWYNTTSDTFKSVLVSETFTSVGALNYARDALQVGSVGTQTAGIAFGGRTHPPESFRGETEEYNGSGWSSEDILNVARFSGAGFATQTTAVMAGGNRPGSSPDGRSDVEEFNGSSWTNATALPAGRYGAMGAGTLTAGVVAGGATGTYPFTAQSTSFEYDGTNWTSGGTMNKGRWIGASGGPQTAALFFGGSDTTSSPNTTNTESYDGTSFTALSALPTAVRSNMGSGDTSSAVSYGGGNPSAVTTAFTWDGSSWSTSPATLGTARDEGSSSGTGTAAVTGGGSPPDAGLTISEEYNKSTNVITAAAWASGGALTVAVYDGAGAGTQTAGLAFGGDTAPDGTAAGSYEYDGTSWTAGNSLNNGRRELNGFGTQTAGVAALGGDTPATTYTEEYDGTNWSNANAASTARTMMGAAGIQTSGLVCGGNPGTMTTTEEYDGTNWSSGGALPVGKQSNDCFGTTSDAVRNVGGNTSPANYVSTTESYNGSSWTSGPTMLYGADRLAASGSSTSGLVSGGRESGTKTAKCANFDGTSYASNANLSNARSGQMATGKGETSNASSFLAGGYNPSNARMTATEEFTGETTSANIADFTTS